MVTHHIDYLVKVILFHAICYALYWTLFRSSKYFSLNRTYLLSTLVLGFIVPLIVIPAFTLSAIPAFPDVNVGQGSFSEVEVEVVRPDFQFQGYVHTLVPDLIYIGGVLILAVRGFLSVMWIRRVRARARRAEGPESDPKVLTISEPMSFSFINTIFLHESADNAVLLHEKGHVRGKHWIDLIALEVICVVIWINPFVWLYRRSLRQQHEYLADSYALRQGVSARDYLLCILNSLDTQEPFGPVHKFNSKSLKQRISMMTKDRSSNYARALYIGVVPILALLFLSFANKQDPVGLARDNKIFMIDAGHGGSDAGAVSASGVYEKEIVLELAALVQEIGKNKGLNILLTRSTDRNLTLSERIALSTEAGADVFLSLHLGSDEGNGRQGASMFISESNAKYADSKKLAAVLNQELGSIKKLGSPEVRNAAFIVLKDNPAASMILEAGILSDKRDAEFLGDAKNLRKIAEKIVAALIRY